VPTSQAPTSNQAGERSVKAKFMDSMLGDLSGSDVSSTDEE